MGELPDSVLAPFLYYIKIIYHYPPAAIDISVSMWYNKIIKRKQSVNNIKRKTLLRQINIYKETKT